MQEKELKAFIKENSPFIYEYMNSVVLKDIGVMNREFFEKLIKDFFNKTKRRYKIENMTKDSFVYYLIAEVLGTAKWPFIYFRKETMTLDELYKELRLYFNYVKFNIQEDYFCVDFIQSKAGVTAYEEEIVKFSKKFALKKGIEEFISKKEDIYLTKELKNIKENI